MKQLGGKKYKYGKWTVALRIVFQEMRGKRSLKPLKLLFKKTFYGDAFPYRIKTTLPEYANFCRINNLRLELPEGELA